MDSGEPAANDDTAGSGNGPTSAAGRMEEDDLQRQAGGHAEDTGGLHGKAAGFTLSPIDLWGAIQLRPSLLGQVSNLFRQPLSPVLCPPTPYFLPTPYCQLPSAIPVLSKSFWLSRELHLASSACPLCVSVRSTSLLPVYSLQTGHEVTDLR